MSNNYQLIKINGLIFWQNIETGELILRKVSNELKQYLEGEKK